MDFSTPAGPVEDVVFRPRRGRQVRSCLVWLGVGAVCGLLARNGAGAGEGQTILRLYAIFCIGLSVRRLILLLRGAPRLTMGDWGLTLKTMLGSRTAGWSDLEPFALTSHGRLWRRRVQLVAQIIGPGGKPGAVHRSFTIPDAFHSPLSTIKGTLEHWHGKHGTGAQDHREWERLGAIGVAGFRWAWLTTGLVGSIVVIFILEQLFAIGPSAIGLAPSLTTLVALGGLSRRLVEAGQGWRVLTAPFLHASLVHLLANSLTLGFAGYALERFSGRVWTLCIFFTGAVAGALGSLAFNAANTVTVGSSGAIMAMVAAVFVMSFHLPASRTKSRMQGYAVRVGIPSLIPISQTGTAMHIDYGAHGGGAVAGMLLGLLMLATWSGASPLPRLRSVAGLVVGIAIVACGMSAYAVAEGYPAYAGVGSLIPANQYPKPAEADAKAPRLLAMYPDDPRSSFLAGIAKVHQHDLAAAEPLLRTAVTKAEAQPWNFRPNLANVFRGPLAGLLLDEGREAEARSIARQACSGTGDAAIEPVERLALVKAGLCDLRS